MAKNKISEFSSTPANNTDIAGINIAEGCAPSGINNAIRELMAQLKDQQSGTDGDSFTVGGNLTVSSTLTANSSVGTSGQSLVSRGAGLSPQWENMVVSGMIVLWSGSIASIPSGWYLCNGSNGTPDLRDRFVMGAGTTAVGATGGSKDAIVVSHTHTATVTDPGHLHTGGVSGYGQGNVGGTGNPSGGISNTGTATTGISVSNSTTGSSGTNANLPPYYALAYIMKA